MTNLSKNSALKWLDNLRIPLFLILGMIASIQQVHGALLTFTLNYSALLENDAGFTIVVDGISNGTPFSIDSPTSGTIFELNNLNDVVNVTYSGFANSDPSGNPSLRGKSNPQIQALIDFGKNFAGGAGNPDDPTGEFGLLWVAAIAMAWDIDANGADAFTTANQSVIGPIAPLTSNGCSSDTLFGDSLNGVDQGTFGAPCSGTTSWSWLSSDMPTQGQAGDFFTRGTATNNAEAYASTATYTTTMSFGIAASAVPVPAAAWLFGSGLLGLIGIARRKKTA